MKPLSALEKHMFRDMMNRANALIVDLFEQEQDPRSVVVIERVANILISRLRRFLRTMSDDEIYELTKNIPALKRLRAIEKRLLSKTIKKFMI